MSSSKLNTSLASDILNKLFKSLIISGLLIYVIYISSFHNTSIINPTKTSLSHPRSRPHPRPHPLNASHIVFGIAATASTWRNRKHYVESWWQPNTTRGYIFFEKMHPDLHPWPNDHNSTLPPFRISQDTSRYRDYDRHKARQAIRMALIISETLELEKKQGGARWYFLGDDDTVVFVENLVEVLGRYDDRKMLYIGMNSETHGSNVLFSFEMAFGGGGCALSYPLAEALAANLDVCLKRYPTLYGSDHILQSCVADLGVSITRENGFHQIDLHNDISGFLSAHAQAPLVSLHHLEQVEAIFPGMSRNESLKHLMKAGAGDQSRLLQQSICYHKPLNWTFSVSWGYSVHIYESIIPPSLLQRPLQTFSPWTKWAHPFFLFNTRLPSKFNLPCEAPHHFFFHSLILNHDYVVTEYSRGRPRALPPCLPAGNHSAHSVSAITLLSPAAKYHVIGNRRECCDVSHGINATEIKLRDCHENEIIP